MSKRIVSFILVMCVCLSLFVLASAISFREGSDCSLSIKYHYIPVLKDSATGHLGRADVFSYNDIHSLYSQVTVTAYNSSKSESATQNCNDAAAIFEGYTDYTDATAKIRAITSATANFLIGADTGTARQYASWTK